MKKFLFIILCLFLTFVGIARVDTVCATSSNSVTQPIEERTVSYVSYYESVLTDLQNLEIEKECIIGEDTAPYPSRYVHSEEYKEAEYVWNYLVDQDFNDYIIAGIFGNLMQETGGRTLAIKPNLTSTDGYYGIAQWSKKFNPYVVGKDLEYQCEYLMSNIKYEFDTYGRNYKSGFKYEQFLELQDEKEAALAFAKCYERCSSKSYELRKENATKALEYFKGNN